MTVTEGSARIEADEQVFYNKIMEFNRDLSICAINAWNNSTLPLSSKLANPDTNQTSLPENKQKRINQALECLSVSSSTYLMNENVAPECTPKEITILEAFAGNNLILIPSYGASINSVC